MEKSLDEPIQLRPFQQGDEQKIRAILTRIGWEENYINSFEQAALEFNGRLDSAVAMAYFLNKPVGFVFVEIHSWNQLAQLQGLGVDPGSQRKGIATKLVQWAENFAQKNHARGIYVDTPVNNDHGRAFYMAAGYQVGYLMPRYYAIDLDGVTYQKFFDLEKG